MVCHQRQWAVRRVTTMVFATAAAAALLLTSCASMIAPSATESGPRTVLLNGEAYSEEDVGGFTSWYCKDYVERGRVLVEVGFFGDPGPEGYGFVLYDGGYSGERAYYSRTGLEHRWGWGTNLDYVFVIEPDGTGLYYDFSGASVGERRSATEVYYCRQR